MARVMVVDDEASFRALLRDILEEAGHTVVEATDGLDALTRLGEGPFQLFLVDQRMPRMGGLELIRQLRGRPAVPPIIMLTAYGTIPDAVEAIRLGAADYLTKPLDSPAALLAAVNRVLVPDTGEETFVTADPGLRSLLESTDRVSQHDVAVLITGESGTGKELIARRVHAASPRAGGAFVAVNCAALPEALAESELFGHERGAFTGADRQRRGRFEEAHGGTLFLDEVGDLTPALQAKLLRVLEDRIVRRLGGSQDITVDSRLIAATNRDLGAAVEAGAFRKDLYFRLAVVTLSLPPLRERVDDIPLLAQHIMRRLGARHSVAVPQITDDAMRTLIRHHWPGNARELRNVLERALLVHAGDRIDAGDLRLSDEKGAVEGVSLDRGERERAAVLEALRRSNGNREEAARLLGVSVRTLYYRLQKFGIS